jgi:hypothetical protein
LRGAKERDKFTFVSAWAAEPQTLMQAMLDNEPNMFHFSGHGEKNGLFFEDKNGKPKQISVPALNNLFEIVTDEKPIKCVILNACYSDEQAKGIAQYVDYVIGTKDEIPDKVAINFISGFYDALGAGKDIDVSFKLGRSRLLLEYFDNPEFADLVVLHTKEA